MLKKGKKKDRSKERKAGSTLGKGGGLEGRREIYRMQRKRSGCMKGRGEGFSGSPGAS